MAALTTADANKNFEEKVSGAVVDRRALVQAIAALRPGYTLLVTRLDRLARSTLQLLTVLPRLNQSGALIRPLSDAWACTTITHGRLKLAVLGGLAEFERELIKSRTSERRRRVTARGIKTARNSNSAMISDASLLRSAPKAGVSGSSRVLVVSKATIGRIPAREID